MNRATLYLDLASPYAYLAAARVRSVIDAEVEFQAVLLGAIFKRRGWGSWAETDGRASGMAEIERRAQAYGLPPIVWPARWPANALAAGRAAIWAGRRGVGERFMLTLYRHEFGHGADISESQVLRAAAAESGLDSDELIEAIGQPEVKHALREATDTAWDLGVRGVPSLRVGDQVFYGDDRLEEAHASSVAGSR